MSWNTRKPVRVHGGVPYSGQINTGAVRTVHEGEQVYTSFSGVNATTLICSGPGKLNSVTRWTAASGSNVLFIDATAATSGAPFSTSGHQILGAITQAIPQLSGIVSQVFTPIGVPVIIDAPFTSGLYAAPLASGTPSFSVTYTKAISG